MKRVEQRWGSTLRRLHAPQWHHGKAKDFEGPAPRRKRVWQGQPPKGINGKPHVVEGSGLRVLFWPCVGEVHNEVYEYQRSTSSFNGRAHEEPVEEWWSIVGKVPGVVMTRAEIDAGLEYVKTMMLWHAQDAIRKALIDEQRIPF